MLKNGEPVPDSLILRILKDRLNTTECKRQGWCMVGIPTNIEQVNMMKEMMQQPSHFISIDMSDYLIYEKVEQRRWDPVKDRYVYLLKENITDERVLSRLVHRPEDVHDILKERLLEYRSFMQ